MNSKRRTFDPRRQERRSTDLKLMDQHGVVVRVPLDPKWWPCLENNIPLATQLQGRAIIAYSVYFAVYGKDGMENALKPCMIRPVELRKMATDVSRGSLRWVMGVERAFAAAVRLIAVFDDPWKHLGPVLP